MGMNASIISGSIMGSPSKMSQRNYMSQDQQSIVTPQMRVSLKWCLIFFSMEGTWDLVGTIRRR